MIKLPSIITLLFVLLLEKSNAESSSYLRRKTKEIVVKECDPTICFLEKDAGNCRGMHPRWYFNGEECTFFFYGGCLKGGGNANNFNTPDQCRTRCDNCAFSDKTDDGIIIEDTTTKNDDFLPEDSTPYTYSSPSPLKPSVGPLSLVIESEFSEEDDEDSIDAEEEKPLISDTVLSSDSLEEDDEDSIDAEDVDKIDAEDEDSIDAEDEDNIDAEDEDSIDAEDVDNIDAEDEDSIDAEDVDNIDAEDVDNINAEDVDNIDAEDVDNIDAEDVDNIDAEDVDNIDAEDEDSIDAEDEDSIDAEYEVEKTKISNIEIFDTSLISPLLLSDSSEDDGKKGKPLISGTVEDDTKNDNVSTYFKAEPKEVEDNTTPNKKETLFGFATHPLCTITPPSAQLVSPTREVYIFPEKAEDDDVKIVITCQNAQLSGVYGLISDQNCPLIQDACPFAWTSLVGGNGQTAKALIQNEMPSYMNIIIVEGNFDYLSAAYQKDRICIFVDDDWNVIVPPQIG